MMMTERQSCVSALPSSTHYSIPVYEAVVLGQYQSEWRMWYTAGYALVEVEKDVPRQKDGELSLYIFDSLPP